MADDNLENGIDLDFDINSPEYLFKQREHNINIDTLTYYLHSSIVDCETLYEIQSAFNIIEKYNPELEEINVQINSPGGDIYEMYGIIDFFNSRKYKVNVSCFGQACSAGAWILCCTTGKRSLGRYSTIMLHEGSYSVNDKFNVIKDTFGHLEYLEEIGYQMLFEKTGIDIDFWKEKCKKDYFLTAKQALELNLIDEII